MSFAAVKCPVCGKEYIPAPQHAYKVEKKGKGVRVCSWSCVRNWNKEKSGVPYAGIK